MVRDLGGGTIDMDGYVFVPFAGWTGGFRFFETATRYYVGAGQDGGPRVAVFARATKQRLRGDFFAGDPTSRAGVYFVATAADPIAFGSGFWLYLAVERDYGGDWAWLVARRVAELYAGCGVGVTTRRPLRPPGDYGTCVVGDGAAWFPGAAGNAPTDRFGLTPGGYDPQQVYSLALADPLATAADVAHECGHGFGLPHVTTPNSIMQANAMPAGNFDDGLKARVRARTAAYH